MGAVGAVGAVGAMDAMGAVGAMGAMGATGAMGAMGAVGAVAYAQPPFAPRLYQRWYITSRGAVAIQHVRSRLSPHAPATAVGRRLSLGSAALLAVVFCRRCKWPGLVRSSWAWVVLAAGVPKHTGSRRQVEMLEKFDISFGEKSDVRKAYVATLAALAGVTTGTIKIFRVADGATAAASRRRLAAKQVSFDVEMKVANHAGAGVTLAAKVTLITDADILTKFKIELVALGEVVPAGLAVSKTAPVVAEATSTSIDWGLSGALLAAVLLVTVCSWIIWARLSSENPHTSSPCPSQARWQ